MSLSVSECSNYSTWNGIYEKDGKTANSDATKTEGQSDKTTGEIELEETVTELAKKDAAKDVYMGPEYQQIHREYVSEVSPDRAAYIAAAKRLASSKHEYNAKDGIDSLLDLLFHTPEKEKADSSDDIVRIYDENGEAIVGHSSMDGSWFALPTAAENARDMKLTFMYYDAFSSARKAIKAGGKSGNGTIMDVKA